MIVAAVLIWLTDRFGSAHAVLGMVRGDTLIVDTDPTSVVTIGLGAVGTVTCTVRNVTWSPLRIIGAHDTCDCVVVENLPFELASGESKQLSVRISVGKNEQRNSFEQSVGLFVNSPNRVFVLKVPVVVSR